MSWDIDLFFEYNYGTVKKDHCSCILSCSSKGRKSLPTSASKTEHFFHRTPPSGCLL